MMRHEVIPPKAARRKRPARKQSWKVGLSADSGPWETTPSILLIPFIPLGTVQMLWA